MCIRVVKRKIERRMLWQLRSYLKGMTCLRILKICEPVGEDRGGGVGEVLQ